jgi:hypothetical protein
MGEVIPFNNNRKRSKSKMKKYHWLVLALVIFVAYLAGVAYPTLGRPIVSKIGLGAA